MSASGLVLSLFPGADLLGMAFEREGFSVVRGPDVLLGGDIRTFHMIPGKVDGVIGGPPCKSFSRAIARTGGSEHATQGNLIPEFVRVVEEAQPKWWVMENVPEAPEPNLEPRNSVVLEAHAFGSSSMRRRRFTSNLPLTNASRFEVPPDKRHPDPWPTITATEYKVSPGSSKYTMKARAGRKVGRRLTLAEMRAGMGLPETFDTPALTVASQYAVIGNGVPLPLGSAVAKTVAFCLAYDLAPPKIKYADECSPCGQCGEPYCEEHDMHYADCSCRGPHSEDACATT